jgi:hypothetical protein
MVAEGFHTLARATREAAASREAPALRTFAAAGGVVDVATADQRAEFRAATSGLRDWYVRRYGRLWLDRLDAAVAACELKTGGAG